MKKDQNIIADILKEIKSQKQNYGMPIHIVSQAAIVGSFGNSLIRQSLAIKYGQMRDLEDNINMRLTAIETAAAAIRFIQELDKTNKHDNNLQDPNREIPHEDNWEEQRDIAPLGGIEHEASGEEKHSVVGEAN